MDKDSAQVRAPSANGICNALAIAVVVSVAAILALSRLVHYADDVGELWRGLNADRNAHFAFGLELALDLRSLDIVEFVKDVINARLWPPVHGLLLAFVLLFGGLDLRLAIVPNLAAWVGTMVLTFLIAREMFADRINGTIAGALAITFAMASPGLRLITSDVYLEGPGAALTAFCCYAYLRGRAGHGDGWWGALAISLTLLFFEKANYWALTAVPLALAYVLEDGKGWIGWARAQAARIDVLPLAIRALRDPFVVSAAVLGVAIVILNARGPTEFSVLGQRVSLYPPANLLTAAWWIIFLRLFLLWRQHRDELARTVPVAARRLLYWHLLPIGLSFLIPKRLATLAWYMGPTNYAGPAPPYRPLGALQFHWQVFSEGYHVAQWVGVLVVALAAVALVRIRQLPRGASGIVLVAAISAMAVVLHPNQQGRFQASWIFAVWVMAGVGGAIVLSWVTARLPALVRIAAAAVVIAGLAFGESRYRSAPTTHWYGVARSGPADFELTKAFLPSVREAKTVGFLVTFPFERSFFDWSVQLDCHCRVRIDFPRHHPRQSREQNRQTAADWLQRTAADRIVVIDGAVYEYAFTNQTYETLSAQMGIIERDERFERIASEYVPSFRASVSVWRRKP